MKRNLLTKFTLTTAAAALAFGAVACEVEDDGVVDDPGMEEDTTDDGL